MPRRLLPAGFLCEGDEARRLEKKRENGEKREIEGLCVCVCMCVCAYMCMCMFKDSLLLIRSRKEIKLGTGEGFFSLIFSAIHGRCK